MAEQTNKLTQTDATVGTTLNVPEAVWKRVKNLATDRRATAQSIWIEAICEYLERNAA